MANLLKVSEAASLAMHTMVLLAKDAERVVSTHEIAGTLKVSEAHLSKVLQRLTKAGLVRSTRGPKGGFLPRTPTEEITLLEVYEAIEGRLAAKKCLLGEPICDGASCILGDLLTTVDRQIRDYLAGTTVGELTRRIEVRT